MANRLSLETSPYLLQHQNNPVDWYPWCEEALERARKENKPILLSVGYSACHWCHVMEHESFENLEVAQTMNENFINIKVDREERPDLDQIYQNVAQIMTQGGGWPLTVFLTPELKPFFGGTYFPPDDRYGRPGFLRVLKALSDAFRNDLESVLGNAEKLMGLIANMEMGDTSGASSKDSGARRKAPGLGDFSRLVETLLSRVDLHAGGMAGAPKFPNSMLFSFLWRYGVAKNHEEARKAVLVSLTQMASGGIYDQLGGGFHRYSVDDTWSVPHFEKMLYDNALLLKLYSEVLLSSRSSENAELYLSRSEREQYLEVLAETTEYVLREMNSPEGVFYSAQDADSEGEEGKFFAWDLLDLEKNLSPVEARVFALRYGVTEEGNFEHGKTVLFQARSIAETAIQADVTEKETRAALASARAKLLLVRNQRIAPGLDDKTLVSWNGLMISGLAWAAEALTANGLDEVGEKARNAAEKAFEFLVSHLSRDGDRLFSTLQKGTPKLNAYLDDYAFLALGALDLSRFAKDPKHIQRYLGHCEKWIQTILKHFKGNVSEGYFFTSDDHEKLIQRPKTFFDQAIPSGTAVALTCMAALANLDIQGNGKIFEEELENQLPPLFFAAQGNSFGMGEMLSLCLLSVLGPITVEGTGAQEVCGHPQVFQKPSKEGTPGLLVCHQKTCSLPMAGVKAAQNLIQTKCRF